MSIFFILSNGCAGYKPIYSNNNLEFKIVDYTIKGDKRLGNKIYSKLYNLSRTKKNLDSDKSIILLIDTSLNKNETSKDSSGKILEYKLTLIAKIEILDFLSKTFPKSPFTFVKSQIDFQKISGFSTDHFHILL